MLCDHRNLMALGLLAGVACTAWWPTGYLSSWIKILSTKHGSATRQTLLSSYMCLQTRRP